MTDDEKLQKLHSLGCSFPTSTSELHPHLKASLTESVVGTMVHHPLLVSFFPEGMEDSLNEAYAFKRKRVEEALAEKNYRNFVFTYERAYRVDAFMDIADRLTQQEHWSLFSDVWTDSENIHESMETWLELLYGFQDDPQLMMGEEDRQHYDALPDEFTIYRGGVDDTGLSWTLDRELALWFANRFKKDHEVFERKIQKKEALAYLSDRSEQEIIYSPDPWWPTFKQVKYTGNKS